jgi:hypothetical protein
MSISDAQLNALVIVPHFTGFFSMVASAFLIFEGYREYRAGKSSTITRAVIGIGVSDFISSFGWFLSSWMLPDWYGMPFSTGNDRTW